MRSVNFYHVTVLFSDVENAEEAYDKLCDLLAKGGVADWQTDTYEELDVDEKRLRYGPTDELWPFNRKGATGGKEED